MASDDRADCRWNARVIMYHADLEPMFSEFITAHPRCPKDPDLPAVRYAIKEFMEEQAPSIFFKERWAASYNPARKVTYVSWFLDTIAYFLDKLDFTTLASPPVETKFPVFIAEPPSAPLDPAPPQCSQAPAASSPSVASRPIAAGPPSRPASPGSGMPAGLQAWRHWRRGTPSPTSPRTREAAAERPARAWATPENVVHFRLDD
jgi:hypothetical protein